MNLITLYMSLVSVCERQTLNSCAVIVHNRRKRGITCMTYFWRLNI